MLWRMRGEWDMEFVGGGKLALARMEQRNFDVIVSDMCMPGMNGAELLNQVLLRFPKTARLVLSGQADKELILKCVGSAHQYITKPCEPESLRATLRRASSIASSLDNEKLRHLVGQMDRLPSIPSLYSEIVKLLQHPETTVEEVGELIGRDIGMTAKILKLVNSAFFGLRRQISTPEEATTYLGLDTIRALVLSIDAFSQFETVRSEGLCLEALSDHCLETAAMAKCIAKAESAEQKLADEAFTAGMLHDIGKLVLAVNFPDQFNNALLTAARENVELTAVETELFGAHHADVGGYLLGLWGLSTPVVEAIALHHSPSRSVEKAFTPLTAVHVANTLAHKSAVTKTRIPRSQIDQAYIAELGLAERLAFWKVQLPKEAF
jgi:HD-like signal output (HDOD) protein